MLCHDSLWHTWWKQRALSESCTVWAAVVFSQHDCHQCDSLHTAEGAPWRQQKESDTVKPTDTYRYHPPSGPSDIETSAYCLLAYNMIRKVTEGREILLWLQKQQNSRGGFGSTQVQCEIWTGCSLSWFACSCVQGLLSFKYSSENKYRYYENGWFWRQSGQKILSIIIFERYLVQNQL